MKQYKILSKFYKNSSQYRVGDVELFSDDDARDLIRNNLILPYAAEKKKDIIEPFVLPAGEALPEKILKKSGSGKKKGTLSLSQTRLSE